MAFKGLFFKKKKNLILSKTNNEIIIMFRYVEQIIRKKNLLLQF